MKAVRPLLALALLAVTAAAGRADGDCELEPGREARVARVIDGETVELEGGETVRLVGALAPRPPGWWKGPGPWRPAERARQALERMVSARSVHLALAGRERDRRNRLLAHLFVVDELEMIWVQGRLVGEGHARAYSLPGSRACVGALLAREARAREARSGIWAGGSGPVPTTRSPTPARPTSWRSAAMRSRSWKGGWSRSARPGTGPS